MALTCPYCFYYFHPVKRKFKGNKEIRRFCGKKRKWLTSDSSTCNNFLLKLDFWCNKNNHWKKIVACLDQRQWYDDCDNCRQFDQDISTLAQLLLEESPKVRKKKVEDFKENKFGSRSKRKVVKRKRSNERKVVERKGRKKKSRKIIRRR